MIQELLSPFILESVLPFSKETYCGSDVLVQVIEMEIVKVPFHKLHIRSDLITDFVKVAVRIQLSMKGVTVILGNDLAGGKVRPLPEVFENPLSAIPALSKEDAEDLIVFPACVITQAQLRKFPNVVDLSDSFFVVIDDSDPVSLQGVCVCVVVLCRWC